MWTSLVQQEGQPPVKDDFLLRERCARDICEAHVECLRKVIQLKRTAEARLWPCSDESSRGDRTAGEYLSLLRNVKNTAGTTPIPCSEPSNQARSDHLAPPTRCRWC